MSRAKRPDNWIRAQFEFTEEEKALMEKALMEKLKLETGAASMSEVLRRALRLYGKLMQRVSEGATLVIRDADGKEQTIWMI